MIDRVTKSIVNMPGNCSILVAVTDGETFLSVDVDVELKAILAGEMGSYVFSITQPDGSVKEEDCVSAIEIHVDELCAKILEKLKEKYTAIEFTDDAKVKTYIAGTAPGSNNASISFELDMGIS